MKVALKVVAGPGLGRVVEFSEPRGFLIGRAVEADFRLPEDDKHVSRAHAYLEICPPNCRVRDIGMTNPLHVNGSEVVEADLQDGDILELGYTRFKVSVTGVASPLPEVKCLKCGRLLDLAPNEAPPELCGPCASARKSAIAAAPPPPKGIANCRHCGKDLSGRANSDGRAVELAGIVEYSCEECLPFEDELRGRSIGEYALVRQLGEGGMGVVYMAHHSSTRRVVAVKQIKGLKDEIFRKRFEHESRVAEALIHRNIVRGLQTGTHSDGPFIVTEFVSGGDLEKHLRTAGGKLRTDEAIYLVRQLLDAAGFMHQQQTIHRDIKPLNILLRDTNMRQTIERPEQVHVVKLTDFGLAKRYNEVGGLTALNQAMGTLMYMSPEHVQDARGVRERGDLYSVGVTLYYLLSGKYSFDFPTPRDVEEVMKQDPEKWKSPEEALKWIMRMNRIKHPYNIILTDTPTPIRERDPSIPKRLADVVDKAVMKGIGERYQSAAEFRTALNEAV